MNPPATKPTKPTKGPRGKGKAAAKAPKAPPKPKKVRVSDSSLDHVLGVIRALLLRAGGEVRLTIDDGQMVATVAVQLARRPRPVDPKAPQKPLPGVEPTDDTSSGPEHDEGRVEASAEIPTTSMTSTSTPSADEDLDGRVIFYLPRGVWDRLGEWPQDQLHRPTGSPRPEMAVAWTVLATTARSEPLEETDPRTASLRRLAERMGLVELGADEPRCKHCGCVEEIACPGGCTWAEPTEGMEDVCSQCVEAHAALHDHLADQVLRLSCPLDGEGAAYGLLPRGDWSDFRRGACVETQFATEHGVLVAWSHIGNHIVSTCVPRWVADLYMKRWPDAAWRIEHAGDDAAETTLSIGTIVYELLVDDPRGAAPEQRFDVIGVDAEAVRGRWGDGELDVDIPVDGLELVPSSQRLDGLVPGFWRVRASTPSQSPKRRAKGAGARAALNAVDTGMRELAPRGPRATLDALRVGMRVRISSSAGGIEGVPVSLAGLFGVVEKVGPKRVQVRPEGRDRAWSIPPHQLELVEGEAASSPSKRAAVAKPYRDQGHSFDVRVRTGSPNVACVVVGPSNAVTLHQRSKSLTDAAWRAWVAELVEALPAGTVARLYSQRGRCIWDSRDGGRP